jgi:hypothetical protein
VEARRLTASAMHIPLRRKNGVRGVKEAAVRSAATRPTWLRLGAEVGRIGRGATLRLAAYTGRSPKVNGLKGSFRQERKTREGYLYEPF